MESENSTNTDNLPNNATVPSSIESSEISSSDAHEPDTLMGTGTALDNENKTATNVGEEAATAARVDMTDADQEAIVESEVNKEDATDSVPTSESPSTSAAGENAIDAMDASRTENAGPLDDTLTEKENDKEEFVANVDSEAKQTADDASGNDEEPEEIVDEVSENDSEHAASGGTAEDDHYEDEDSRDVVEGGAHEIQDTGSELSPAEEDDDDADEGVEEYDSNDDRDEAGMEHKRHARAEDDDDDVAVISDTTIEDDDDEDLDDDASQDGSRDRDDSDRERKSSYSDRERKSSYSDRERRRSYSDRERRRSYSDRDNRNYSEQLYGDSDDMISETSEQDYRNDDDDLMDEIVVSRRERKRSSSSRGSSRRSEHRQKERRFKNAKVTKRKQICDWRLKMKKRSVKWLKSARMRNVSESHGDVTVLDYLVSNVTSTPNKIHKNTESPTPFIISQVVSISSENNSKVPPQSQENIITTSEMQQINKIQDCVKKSSQDECQEIKQSCQQQNQQIDSRHQVVSTDDNNKENIGDNEKTARHLSKINGIASNEDVDSRVSHSAAIAKEATINFEESDDMEVMEISDEPSGEASSLEGVNATVIDTNEDEYVEHKIKDKSTCDIKSLRVNDDMMNGKENEMEIADNKEHAETLLYGTTKKDEMTENLPQSLDLKIKEPTEIPKSESPGECPVKETIETTIVNVEATADKSQIETVPPAEISCKRTRSPGAEEKADVEDVHPAKKLKSQMDANFSTHDEILNEYIERTSNNSIDEIQKHLGQLIVEIQTLNDMIKAKETEWNNLLHLKKVKEEICLRLTRKKQVLDIMSTKIGHVNDGGGDTNLHGSYMENLNSLASDICQNKFLSSAILAATGSYANTTISPAVSTPMATSKSLAAVGASSTPNNVSQEVPVNYAQVTASLINNLSNISAISASGVQSHQQQQLQNSSGNSIGNSLVQNILQNRANMKSSDLVKEKATTQRLHRILVSRNILPKPSTATSAAGLAANGDLSAATNNVSLSLLSKHANTSLTSSFNATITSAPSLTISGANAPMNLTNSNTNCHMSADNEQQPILNNYLTASATATLQKQLGEMLNGHHNFRSGQDCGNIANGAQGLGFGRQGAFKDVKSIIADYRQKHPEVVPRRGRRVKSSSGMGGSMHQGDASTILGNVLKSDSRGSTDLGALLSKIDGNSRPSSNDSSHSAANPANNIGNMSFKDVLIQFAKMNEQNNAERSSAALHAKAAAASGQANGTNSSFPEVTLHPVTSMHSSLEQGAGSLLHGILTKFNRPNVSSASSLLPTSTTTSANYNNSFSPTLARLLTAPERITASTNSLLPSFQQSSSTGTHNNTLNISKMVSGHSEITITPVVSSQQVPTLLQQQLEHQQQQHQMSLKRERIKLENLLNAKDDEADDSIDRLVIDEGGDSSIGVEDNLRLAPNAFGLEFNENEVPACQGCKKNEAQFVCAGCANQLYCSRECQVAAWDEHSEVCTG